jgi:hypothetical protein
MNTCLPKERAMDDGDWAQVQGGCESLLEKPKLARAPRKATERKSRATSHDR